MSKLVFYEVKKLFHRKGICFLLLCMILLPPFFVPKLDEHNHNYMVSDSSGNPIRGYELTAIEDKSLSLYKGNLLEKELSLRIDHDFEINHILSEVDPNKVIERYGKKLSYEELYQKIDEIDESLFYEEFPHRTDYFSSLVHQLYQLNASLTVDNYSSYFINPANSPEEENIRKEIYAKKLNTLKVYVDNMYGFRQLFSTLNIVSFILSFFFLFLMPSIFSEECRHKMLRLLKTTKEGKRRVGLAKVITVVLLSIAIPLVSILFTTLVIHLRYGLQNWNVSATLISNQNMLYSMFGYYIRRMLLMIIGCLGMSVIGAFLSSMISNSYVSLGILIVYYICWMFWTSGTSYIDWRTFTPMHILSDSGTTVLGSGVFLLQSHMISLEWILHIFWMVVTIVLLGLSYIAYQKRQVTNES